MTPILLFAGILLAQTESMQKQIQLGFDQVKKLAAESQFGAVLDFVSKHPTAKWPKIYSVEYCSEKLKSNEQAEALQARKLGEQVVAGLEAFQTKMGGLNQDEFIKSMNRLFDLRDALDQPAYGNIVLELSIDRIATLGIAERVVAHNDDLKALGELVKRKKDWLGEWRTICQMIEEEEGRKIFDYEGMEKVSPEEIFDGRKDWSSYDSLSEKEKKEYIAGKRNPKWLGGDFDPRKPFDPYSAIDEFKIEDLTMGGMFMKRNFGVLLNDIAGLAWGMNEYYASKVLPALILFKQKGGGFNELGEKWMARFDQLMTDYMKKTEMQDWDADTFENIVKFVKGVSSGAIKPGL